MDDRRFDALTKSLTAAGSRRSLLGLVTGAALGAIASRNDTRAKKRNRKRRQHKKHKQKRQSPVLNAFGCVDVGLPCRGDSALCCSGICQGAPPRKGKPDTSACVAHNVGGCTPQRNTCTNSDSNLTRCGSTGDCTMTTGNAGFCADVADVALDVVCRVCARDNDCEALGFPPGSACVLAVGAPNCSQPGDTCAGINGSAGTACLPPGAPA